MNPTPPLTPNQRATIAGVLTSGLLLLTFGVIVLIFDVANVQEVCDSGMFGEYCGTSDVDTRGWFIIAYGIIIALAAAVARSVLKKAAKPTTQPVTPQIRHAGMGTTTHYVNTALAAEQASHQQNPPAPQQ